MLTGAVLAGCTAKDVIHEVAATTPGDQTPPDWVIYVPSFFLRGIPELPVRVHPRGPA